MLRRKRPAQRVGQDDASLAGNLTPRPLRTGAVLTIRVRREQSSDLASRVMIVDMRKAEDPGPDSPVDDPQGVEVTGDLPMSLTTFVGRE